jgi:hypothetical protein
MAKKVLTVATVLLFAAVANAQPEEALQPVGPETAAAPTPAPTVARPAMPAPTVIKPGAVLFIEPSEFGMALAAAILKKKVPVVAGTDREKAEFFVRTVSNAKQEKTGERVAKVLLFGAWAGSGRSFDATVTITNRDGAIIFAHNSKKENFQSAAQNIAKNLKKQIEGN